MREKKKGGREKKRKKNRANYKEKMREGVRVQYHYYYYLFILQNINKCSTRYNNHYILFHTSISLHNVLFVG